MKVKFKFDIGDEVKDKYSGLEGSVISLTQWINGCIQIGVQPMSKDPSVLIDATYIDQPQLDHINSELDLTLDGSRKKVEFKFDLGEFVKDKYSNFEGYIIAVVFGFQANRYVLQPKSEDSTKIPSINTIEENRLISINRDQVVELKKKDDLGGPNRPVQPNTKVY